MGIFCETPEMFQSHAMQRYIQTQRQRECRQWVYAIVNKLREHESVIYRDDDTGFVLVSCANEKTGRSKGYIAIAYDPRLRCLRDLRGSDVGFLKTMKQACLKNLPPDVTHCSVHYHPSVYQLHVHFRVPELAKPCEARSFMLDDIIANLSKDADFYITRNLSFAVAPGSEIGRLLCSMCLPHPGQHILCHRKSYKSCAASRDPRCTQKRREKAERATTFA